MPTVSSWSECCAAVVLLAGAVAATVALRVEASAVTVRSQQRSDQLAVLREVVASRSPIEERENEPIRAFDDLFTGLRVVCRRTERGVFLALQPAQPAAERQ